MESLEDFAINGGYKKVGVSSYMPSQKMIQDWGRFFALKKIKFMKQIDEFWHEHGLMEYVSAPHHYTITFSLAIFPAMIIMSIVCYCIDQSEEKPSYDGTSQPTRTNRPDKLD